MLNYKWFLVIQVIFQGICHRVLITNKVQWFTVWNENFATDEARFEQFISDKVPFRSIEIDHKIGERMFQSKLFSEVPVTFMHGLHLVNSLRKACKTIKRFILSVNIVYDVINGLKNVFEIGLCLRNSRLLTSIRHYSVGLISHGHPSFIGWRDTLIYKVLYWRIFGVTRTFDEWKFAKFTHCIDKVLHLVHHDLVVIVVAMEA